MGDFQSQRIPWPEFGIEFYAEISDGRWGWLYQTADGRFAFDMTSPPTEDEIMARWGYRFFGVINDGHTETT